MIYLVLGNFIVGLFLKIGVGGIVYCFYNFGSLGLGIVMLSNNNFFNIILMGVIGFDGIE